MPVQKVSDLDIDEEVEKHIPKDLHLRRVFNRPKFGEWVSTRATGLCIAVLCKEVPWLRSTTVAGLL